MLSVHSLSRITSTEWFVLPYTERHILPEKQAVYVFVFHGNISDYVGQTKYLRTRMRQHHCTRYSLDGQEYPALIYYSLIRGSYKYRKKLEARVIKYLKPPKNKVGNPDYKRQGKGVFVPREQSLLPPSIEQLCIPFMTQSLCLPENQECEKIESITYRVNSYRTKKNSNKLFQQFKMDYKKGVLEGMSMNAMGKKYVVTGATIKRWITKIETNIETNTKTKIKANKEEKETISTKPKKQEKKLVPGIPKDWEWIRITVSSEVKTEFDKLPLDQKVLLYKLFNRELLAGPSISGCPIVENPTESLVNKTITLKVSLDALAAWRGLPTIRKNNQFSRASWVINTIVIPFITLAVK